MGITTADKAFIGGIVVFILLEAAAYFKVPVDPHLQSLLISLITGSAVYGAQNKDS